MVSPLPPWNPPSTLNRYPLKRVLVFDLSRGRTRGPRGTPRERYWCEKAPYTVLLPRRALTIKDPKLGVRDEGEEI